MTKIIDRDPHVAVIYCRNGRIGMRTRNFELFAFAIFQLLCAGPCSSTESFFPRPPTWGQHQVVDGWPWSAIGRINVAGQVFCTGVLVAPRVVLTAAQCAVVGFLRGQQETLYKTLSPSRLVFRAGFEQNHDLGNSEAISVYISPNYNPLDSREKAAPNDWAVLVLKVPLAVRPLRVRSISFETVQSLSDKQLISQAGYGWDRPYGLSLFRPCPITVKAETFHMGCLSTFGYAGAPLIFIDTDGDPSVFAIGSPTPWNIGTPQSAVIPPEQSTGYACPASSFIGQVQKTSQELQ
jgi:hypothetical protein